MKNLFRLITDIVLYIIVFVLAQIVTLGALGLFMPTNTGLAMSLVNIISGLITIAVFVFTRWTLRESFAKRPLSEMLWVGMLALGLLIPSVWLEEMLDVEVEDDLMRLMESIIREPLGFVAVGLVAPVVEEIVFRGAILRRCLEYFSRAQYNNKVSEDNSHWIAIAVSALAFAVAHGNMAQGLHAFLLGLLLGWLYYRTRSVIPGIVLHWVNNIAVFLQCIIMDLDVEATLADMFDGNMTAVHASVIGSMLVAIVSLYFVRRSLNAEQTKG